MEALEVQSASGQRLQRLLGFIERDPKNLPLIADAASAAFDCGELETASALIDRHAALTALPPSMQNLRGLVALAGGDFTSAVAIFERLLATGGADPALRFNLAWAKAMLEDYQAALDLLDEATAAALPAAAALKVQMMHHLGRLEDALTCGEILAEIHPDDTALMGALATAAIDAENLDLAKHYASRAGSQPAGLAAMGMLILNDNDAHAAMEMFDEALAARPDNARALLGKGLALMAEGKSGPAAGWLDKGAEIFGDHLGSWVAAGWAYFVQGDLAASRARFDKAMALDDTFAETHGALAVLDIAENQLESARGRTEVALRLDRKCFAGALAKSLLLMGEGNEAAAERVRTIALNTPLGESGKTIAQAMASMGTAGRGGSAKN